MRDSTINHPARRFYAMCQLSRLIMKLEDLERDLIDESPFYSTPRLVEARINSISVRMAKATHRYDALEARHCATEP